MTRNVLGAVLEFFGAVFLALVIMIQAVRADTVGMPEGDPCYWCTGCPASLPREEYCSDRSCWALFMPCPGSCKCTFQGRDPNNHMRNLCDCDDT